MTPTTTAAPEALDIGDFSEATECELTIKHPITGAPTALVIILAGPEHPTRKRINLDKQRRMRQILAKTQKLPIASPEEDDEDELDTMAKCTLGWRGMVKGGSVVEFTTAAAHALYADPARTWLRDQVRAGMNEREAFIKRSAAG